MSNNLGWSVGDGKTFIGILNNYILMTRLNFSINFLFGFLNKRFIISQISQDVFRKVVFHHCEIRNYRIYLLGCCLLCHYSEFMLFFVWWLTWFTQSICLLSYVQLRSFTPTGLVRKHLSSLELLLQTILVEPFKLLYVLGNAIDGINLRFLELLRRFFYFLGRSTSWVSEIVESLGFLFIALEF